MTSSPKIQRLVTPLRLQRRRHLLALKKRRLDHQKEQKAEYEYVDFFFESSSHINVLFFFPTSVSSSPSALPRKKPRPPPSKHRTTRVRNSCTLRPIFREALFVAKYTSWIGSGWALGTSNKIILLSVDPVVQVARFVC